MHAISLTALKRFVRRLRHPTAIGRIGVLAEPSYTDRQADWAHGVKVGRSGP